MNSKLLLALFVVGLVAVSFAQEQKQQDQKNVEMFEDGQQERPERDASFEVADGEEQENLRVKRQWGYGGYGGYGYGYRPFRPWRRFGGYGYNPYGYGYYG